MSAADREAIMDALLARLGDSVEGLRDITRREAHFDEIRKPGLQLLTDVEESDDLGKWVIEARVVLTVETAANEKSPETQLRALIDQVNDALAARVGEAPGYGNRTTLGGLVESISTVGRTSFVQGSHGGIGESEIPIRIVAWETP